MSKTMSTPPMEAKLLTPNYFKLVPPSAFISQPEEGKQTLQPSGAHDGTVTQVASKVTPLLLQQQQQQQAREVSVIRDTTDDGLFVTGRHTGSLQSEMSPTIFSTSSGNELQATPVPLLQQSGQDPLIPASLSGAKRLHPGLQGQQADLMHENTKVSAGVVRKEADSPTLSSFVAKKLKTMSTTTAQRAPNETQPQLQRVATDGDTTKGTAVEKLLIPAEEVGSYTKNFDPHVKESSQKQSPKVPQRSQTAEESKTSGEAVTAMNLQYDNYFKYAAGRCAIATTKQGWEFADSEEDTELGEVLFHKTLATKLATADKHLQYYDSAVRGKGDDGDGRRKEQQQSKPQTAESDVAQPNKATTPTLLLAHSANDSSVASEFVPTERHVARPSERTGSDFETTTPAYLDSVEFDTNRSLSSGDWSLNDLSVEEGCTPPSNGSCAELFTSLSEEVLHNTFEIEAEQQAGQAVTPPPKPKEPELHQFRSTTGGSSFVPQLETATREERQRAGKKMASSGVQVDTQNDIEIARLLQREEESRSACGFGQSSTYPEFGGLSDHELAEQIQVELDREMAQQIQEEEQHHHHHGGYRTHHDSSYQAHSSGGRPHYDNNGQSFYSKPSERREHYEQGHTHHLYRGYHHHHHRGMHPVQEHGAYGGSGHPMYYHGHFVEQDDDEMEMTYEALSELEDVSRGLDKKTVSQLTNLCEYQPSQALSSANLTTSRSCSICLSDFEKGQMVRSLPCFHSFHRHCIDRWLESNKQCPVCQIEIQPNNS